MCPSTPSTSAADLAIANTRTWLEKAVIGLNLCPFAKAVHVRNQIRYCYTDTASEHDLQMELATELLLLRDADPRLLDTTLLIHPNILNDFLNYNDFLSLADETVASLDLEGIIQIASFHPHYYFAGTASEDITNYTNRSPYPMLHLLREESIDKAIAAYPDTDRIIERNLETLTTLGHEGWRSIWR